MSFFSKKEKVKLSDFCTSYYEHNFHFQEPNLEYFRILKNQIAYVDNNFISIDFEIFCTQITVIKYECFGLAWFYKFGIEKAVTANLVTKEYLESKSQQYLWEELGSYNNISAKSAIHGADSSTISGRSVISLVNNTRVEYFKKLISEGYDNLCVARALNRYGTKIEISVQYLILHLSDVLKHGFTDEALVILYSRIIDFYESVKKDIENIKIIQ